jgi:hypothetical protein
MKKFTQLEIPKDTAWDRFSIRKYLPIWFKQFIDGISNIIRWIPTIYKDKDFDHSFILTILKQKLINQRKYLVSNNRHEGVEDINRYITLTLNLIELYQDSHYELEYYDYHKSVFNFNKVPNTDYSEIEIDHIEDNLDDYFILNKIWYNRAVKYLEDNKNRYNISEPFKDKHIIGSTIGMLKQEKCKELIFKILKEKLDSWWD